MHPNENMVKQIDEDSFNERKLVFQNKLGYYSQWFTKNQVLELLHSDAKPIPINVYQNNETDIFGHVFPSRNI